MKETKKTNLQIRGVPPELLERVRERAAKEGKTMSALVIEVIERRIAAEEKMETWLDEVKRWEPIPVKPGTDVAKAVREAREERGDHLARIVTERRRGRRSA